jgi:hypothetical protein
VKRAARTRTLAEALVATGAFTQKAADMVVMADIVTFVCVESDRNGSGNRRVRLKSDARTYS